MGNAAERLAERMRVIENTPSCIELSPVLHARITREAERHAICRDIHSNDGEPSFMGIDLRRDEALRSPDPDIELGILFYSWDERVTYRELRPFKRLHYALTAQGEAVAPPAYMCVEFGEYVSGPHSHIREDSITLIWDRSKIAPEEMSPDSGD